MWEDRFTKTANDIRAELKAHGWNSRKVSVRQEVAGSAIRIVMKDFSVDENVVRQIARKYQEVDYEEKTGEILAGGNLFVFVDWDMELEDRKAEQLFPLSIKLMDYIEQLYESKHEIHSIIPIVKKGDISLNLVSDDSYQNRFELEADNWNEGYGKRVKRYSVFTSVSLAHILVEVIYKKKWFSLDDFKEVIGNER